MMQARRLFIFKILLDLLMLLAFAALFNSKVLGGMAFHEIAGLGVCAAILLHKLLNRGWIAGVSKKLFSRRLPVRTRIVYGTDLLLLISVAVILVTGILISRVVFAGFLPVRADAQNLHRWAAYLALLLLGVHLGLVWGQVKFKQKHLLKLPDRNKIAGAVAVAAAAAIFASGAHTIASGGYFDKIAAFPSGFSETGRSAGQDRTAAESGGTESGAGEEGAEPDVLVTADGAGTRSGNGKRDGFGQGNRNNTADLAAVLYQNLGITGAFAVLTYYIDKLLCRRRMRAACGH